MVKLQSPVDNFTWRIVSQFFGVNHDRYYEAFKLPGHQGLDIAASYGAPVKAMHAGTIQAIIQDDVTHTKGNGIYLLSEDNSFSTIYWHLSAFNCNVGDKVLAGQIIGRVGNSGYVYPVPSAACPYCGTHLHIGICRWNYTNDYKGFVDPVPWLFNPGDKLPFYFGNNLYFGLSGDAVSWLQTILEIEGFLTTEPIAIFGPKTLAGVSKLQQINGISPALGFFGPKTRYFVNNKYSIYS